MRVSNYRILEAWAALNRIGELDEMSPLAMWRVALNRNALVPLVDAIERARLRLLKEAGVQGLQPGPGLTPEQRAALLRFQEGYQAVLEDAVEFVAPAVLQAEQLNSCRPAPRANDVSRLMLVGIVAPPPEGAKEAQAEAPKEAVP